MVLGPIMMLQPSSRQKRIATLRQTAIEKGLRVRMSSSEGMPQAVYELPWAKKRPSLKGWSLQRKKYVHELHLSEYWAWQGDGRPAPAQVADLRSIIDQLPNDVTYVSYNDGGVAYQWQESGGADALEALLDSLHQLAEL